MKSQSGTRRATVLPRFWILYAPAVFDLAEEVAEFAAH